MDEKKLEKLMKVIDMVLLTIKKFIATKVIK